MGPNLFGGASSSTPGAPGAQARVAAREVLATIPLVMRTVAAELRAAGELPAPAHFGLLTLLSEQPRTLSELAALQGVSLPTMSNSANAIEARGWVRRGTLGRDRRVVVLEVTTTGRAALARVQNAAEVHLASLLVPLDADARRRLRSGLRVLRSVFDRAARPVGAARNRDHREPSGRRASARRGPEPHPVRRVRH
jgi:DNA-binding MarR family transcriptional regulator